MAKADVIDFTGVPKDIRAGGSKHIPAGVYKAKIVKHEKKWKDDDKTNVPYYNWQFLITEGPHKGTPLYYVTSLKHDALFNLRNLIYAATEGKKNVAGSKVSLDATKLYGKIIAIDVEDSTYTKDGKEYTNSKAVAVRPVKDLEEEEAEETEEEEEEEETEETEEEELEDVDLDDV